ncbi:MAG: cell wall-binding repeat-containing protein [Firmicutes bacterium]|nr:cell wall-binding repeat-containing protein [Bacillota bacterium]
MKYNGHVCRKMFSLLLALVLVLGFIPEQARAEGDTPAEGGDGDVEITGRAQDARAYGYDYYVEYTHDWQGNERNTYFVDQNGEYILPVEDGGHIYFVDSSEFGMLKWDVLGKSDSAWLLITNNVLDNARDWYGAMDISKYLWEHNYPFDPDSLPSYLDPESEAVRIYKAQRAAILETTRNEQDALLWRDPISEEEVYYHRYFGLGWHNWVMTPEGFYIDRGGMEDLEISPLDHARFFSLSVGECFLYPVSDIMGPWWTRSRSAASYYIRYWNEFPKGGAIERNIAIVDNDWSHPVTTYRSLPIESKTAGTIPSGGARPAFCLDATRVVLLSAAEGGKQTSEPGNGEFGEFRAASGGGNNEYKMTLLDDSRSGFTASVSKSVFHSGEPLTITYSGARGGGTNFVSAYLSDADGNILYYASVYPEPSGSGEWNLVMPAFDETVKGPFTLTVFNEMQNEDFHPDYASQPVEFTLNQVFYVSIRPEPAEGGDPMIKYHGVMAKRHEVIRGERISEYYYPNPGYSWYSSHNEGWHSPYAATYGDYCVVVEYKPDLSTVLEGEGTPEKPYLIGSETDWKRIDAFLQAGGDTTGVYFRQTANISITTMTGSAEHPFGGHYDGDGFRLTFNLSNHPEVAAPFRYISGADIRNLHVTGNIFGAQQRASGLIGENSGSSTVTNCRVSTAISGSGLIGGFCIGTGDELTITGSVFDGAIIGNPVQSGCFVAWGTSGLHITDSLAAPQSSTTLSGGTFYYAGGGNAVLKNCLYTQAVGRAQGSEAHSVTAVPGVEFNFGDGTDHDVSKLKAYEHGLEYEGVFYAGEGEEITLALPNIERQWKKYVVNAGTLSYTWLNTTYGWQYYTLVMPDEDVVISTEDVPIVYYTVTFTDGLENILKTETVEKWQAATAPADPVREGYAFAGWDKSFRYVTQDLTVNAKWKPAFTVTFVDGLGNTLKTENVMIAKPATPPEEPTREGYIFDGWDTDFSRVLEDLTVTALWKEDPSAVISIQDAKVVLTAATFTYNGEVQKPKIKTIGGRELKAGTDYTAKWSDASSTDAASYTVTITGKGRYTGTAKATYTIKPKAITPGVTLAKKEYTYNGKAQKPAVTVKDGNIKLGSENYTVTYASGRTNAGTYKVTVKMKGNYTGSKSVSFKIVPAKVTLPVAKTGLTYNGAKQTGVAEGTGYTVTGGARTDAGTYTAKAILKDTKNYVWSDGKTTAKSVKWTIGKANLKSASVAKIKDQTFTGAALKPAPVVKMTLNGKSATLQAGTDYQVTYKNNTVPGTATVTITGQGNFTGTKSVTFKIDKAKATATRLSGDNRYATSQAIAEAYRNALGVKQFDAVCVADGTNYPDALAGSFLAALKHAPILSVDKNNPTAANTQSALAYIRKNLKAKGTVYLLGGSGSVPEVLEKTLRSYGFTVKRVWGPNRYTSNLAILKEAGIKAGSEIIVCTGADFADALSASATGKPVLLVGGGSLLAEQKEFLQTLRAGRFTIIGDQTVVAAGIEADLKAFAPTTRITGQTTYQRSIAIARKYFPGIQTHVNIADGKNFPDALCGGPMAVLSGGPLILVDEPDAVMNPVLAYVKAARTFKVTIYGGPGSVSDALVNKILSVN